MDRNKKGSDKKSGFPGVFLIFIIGLVIILTIQNLSDRQNANVSFSHQIEHLTNLDLINPADNTKIAINDQLVSFSGVFRDRLTSSAKERYQFLYLLNQKFSLSDSYNESLAKTEALKVQVLEAAKNFYETTGFAIASHGVSIISDQYQVANYDFSLRLKDGVVPVSYNLQALNVQFKSLVEDDHKSWKLFGQNLSRLVERFSSKQIGIGDEGMKLELKGLERSVRLALNEGDARLVRSSYMAALQSLTQMANTLLSPIEGTRLYQLRTVRNFLDDYKVFHETGAQLAKLKLKLDKSQENVTNVIWYFNNKELSTNMLEKANHEEYHQWFLSAKKEYEAFATNQGLAFKAPDQPRNLVLEKTFKSQEVAPNYFSYLFTFLPILLIGFILYFIFSKQMKGGAGGSAMNFGKSPAKQVNRTLLSITFNDVAGIDEAREELEEIVDFLKNPQKFRALGARVPRGVLLIGPPGTGKTLIAKAVAGEAGVPFFSISGSDFVEMFVGVGASRVRDLFTQAKKSSPCIIFIDEIDAVGRHRGSGMGGGHDEREQTLNQLLVEFDGMESKAGVIIIAATNRPDVLDKALLRPGRFDRHVSIELPDLMGRLAILKVHARRIKVDVKSNLKAIANRTQGASGAELENILNESALAAAKRHHKAVTNEDLNYALEKVLYGKERRSMILEEEDKVTTAWHESGHAYVALVTDCSNQVTKATIIPRGRSLGATHFEPKQNRVNYKKTELQGEIAVLMGGRIAEEIVNNDITSGAQMDIRMATQLARSMVCQWGMSEKIGLIDYSDNGDQTLMAGFQEREYSDETAKIIDTEIKRFLDEGYERSYKLLHDNQDILKAMAEYLLEFETLDKKDLLAVIDGNFSPDEKRKELEEFAQSTKVEPPAMPKRFDKKGGAEPQTS